MFVLIQAIILQVIFFIGLVLVLRKILISSSYAETKRLQQLNEENAHKAQELNAKISDAENEYREKMMNTDEEIRVMKAKAKKEIEDLKEAIIAKSKAESDRIVTQALNARDEIRAEIEEQMYDRAVALAQKIFQKVLGEEEQKPVHDSLVAGVIGELAHIEEERLKSVGLGEGFDGRVKVKLAYPMKPEQNQRLAKILSAKLGQTVTVEEEIDKAILAGIVIALGSFVIDGSFLERFNKAAQELK